MLAELAVILLVVLLNVVLALLDRTSEFDCNIRCKLGELEAISAVSPFASPSKLFIEPEPISSSGKFCSKSSRIFPMSLNGKGI